MKDCCTRDQQQLTDSNTSKIRYKIQADIFVLHKSYHWSKFCERTKYPPPLFSFCQELWLPFFPQDLCPLKLSGIILKNIITAIICPLISPRYSSVIHPSVRSSFKGKGKKVLPVFEQHQLYTHTQRSVMHGAKLLLNSDVPLKLSLLLQRMLMLLLSAYLLCLESSLWILKSTALHWMLLKSHRSWAAPFLQFWE